MLIGILSDTHENLPFIARAVERFNQAKVDLVLHLGDIVAPFCIKELQKLDKARVVAVFGNNDGEKKVWREKIPAVGEIHDAPFEMTAEGQILLLLHEPALLDALAASQRYDVILYGHTHRVDKRSVGKTLILNPGECGGWLYGKNTIALLELPGKDVRIVEL